jgi:hypothetical protein
MATRAFLNAYVEVFYEDTTFEIVSSMAALGFSDDFIGGGHSATLPLAGSPVLGYPWVAKIVGAAPPTVALVSNATGGQIACTLTSASQAQEASFYFNDNLSIDLTKRPIIDYRAALTVVPTLVASAFVGNTQAWASGGALSSARYLGFGFAGNGNLVCYSKDGVNTYAVAAGFMSTPTTAILVDTNFHSFRIDASNTADVAFYYDGQRCNGFGTVTWGATAANSITQPFFSAAKASGAGVATLTVDKVDVWWNRT